MGTKKINNNNNNNNKSKKEPRSKVRLKEKYVRFEALVPVLPNHDFSSRRATRSAMARREGRAQGLGKQTRITDLSITVQ